MGYFVSLLLVCTLSTSLFLPFLSKNGFVSENFNRVEIKSYVPEPGSLPSCVLYLLAIIYLVEASGMKWPVFISLTLGLVIGLLDDFCAFSWGTKILLPLICWIPPRFFLLRPKFLEVTVVNYFELYVTIKGSSACVWEACFLCMFIFLPNAINIYSGLNGLEVGQSLIISFGMYGLGIFYCEKVIKVYTLYFIAICLSMILFNWYPAKMFVGDTFTSFAGVFFANMLALGYNPLKMVLFFTPQIVNFLVSVPQLLGLVFCPRHRIPRVSKNGLLISSGNLTLVNLVLEITGGMHERDIVALLLLLQLAVILSTHLIVQ